MKDRKSYLLDLDLRIEFAKARNETEEVRQLLSWRALIVHASCTAHAHPRIRQELERDRTIYPGWRKACQLGSAERGTRLNGQPVVASTQQQQQAPAPEPEGFVIRLAAEEYHNALVVGTKSNHPFKTKAAAKAAKNRLPEPDRKGAKILPVRYAHRGFRVHWAKTDALVWTNTAELRKSQ